MYKFRTMVTGAERLQQKLQSQNEADGPVFKIWNDPRFTGIGKFLSHTGLDELPQLYNILRGEMAIFGPRPLPVVEAEKIPRRYRDIRESIKPGVLSTWVITGYHRKTFREWMEADVAYVREKSITTDMRIFLRACRLWISFVRRAVRQK